MSCPCYNKLISAGDIPSGEQVYVVAFAPKHKTLSLGDRVVMRENSDYVNLFVRVNDLTLHGLQADGEYILVVQESPHLCHLTDGTDSRSTITQT